jgi:serine O-acetyltransferase
MIFLADIRAKQKLYSEYGQRCSIARAFFSDGTFAIFLYRIQSFLSGIGFTPVALFPHLLNKWINGCVIGVKAQFGPGFVLIHPVGVVINSSVRGGQNVWLESGVVIGENRGQFPTLGSNIFVGSGAKIIGGVQVGDGVKIGANAVVTRDCPAGATMLGVPAAPR